MPKSRHALTSVGSFSDITGFDCVAEELTLGNCAEFLSNFVGGTVIRGGLKLTKSGLVLRAGAKSAPRAASTVVDDAVRMADDWLGPNVRVITNRAGDKVFLSDDGLRRIRFDIKSPAPHSSLHAHVEELVNGRWVKSGPIFPRDVPQR